MIGAVPLALAVALVATDKTNKSQTDGSPALLGGGG